MVILALTLSVLTANAQTDSTTSKQPTTEQLKGHQLHGKASYYGSEYKETRNTANGDRFNKEAYTAAHKTLPFGTVVKVKNLKNNKTVTVRINDRGPFIAGRVIDVTTKAARDLDMIRTGTAPVELEIISMPDKQKNKQNKT